MLSQESFKWPQPCHVESHQQSKHGYCFGIDITPKGRPFALVVIDNGIAEVVYLDDSWSLRLV